MSFTNGQDEVSKSFLFVNGVLGSSILCKIIPNFRGFMGSRVS